MNELKKTIFLDIDGTIIFYNKNLSEQINDSTPILLPGVLDFFLNIEKNGYKIILTTGRKESSRSETEQQLKKLGLFWDHLIMGLPSGERIIINDQKPSGEHMARAFSPPRNQGLEDIKI